MTAAIWDIPLKTIVGEETSLAAYRGNTLLIVNVASKCKLTPQYGLLQALYERFRDRGFCVLGFPANDFAGQEPGTEEEIRDFCLSHFSVRFPMFSKVSVTGPGKHPLFAALTAACPEARGKPGSTFRQAIEKTGLAPNDPPEILWNFEKFLIGFDGSPLARFAPDVAPDDPMIAEAIEADLAG